MGLTEVMVDRWMNNRARYPDRQVLSDLYLEQSAEALGMEIVPV